MGEFEHRLAILEPKVLNGTIEKFTGPEDLQGIKLLLKESHPFAVVNYDIVVGNRDKATLNNPNAEAKIVKPTSVGSVSSKFLYTREKKTLEPTTLHWLRTPGELAKKNAEAAVLRELKDLDNRIMRLVEWSVWKMFSGSLSYNKDGVIVNVDYKISDSHKPTPATLWSDTANADIIGNIRAWKRLIIKDAQTPVTQVWLNGVTMEYVYKNSAIQNLLSDRQKDQYLQTGEIKGLLGIDWHIYDMVYVDDTGAEAYYIPDGAVIMLAPGNNPWKLLEGPSADDSAPQGWTGKFSKSWKVEDPSGRVILVEYTFFPALFRPENVIYATVA